MSNPKSLIRPAGDRGAVAVEFAILLLPLIVLVFGIIDFGQYYRARITLAQAAREGARLDALGTPFGCSPTQLQARTVAAAAGLGLACGDVVPLPCPAGATQTADAVVTVSYTLYFNDPLVSLIGLTPKKTVVATGRMPCQG